MDTIIYTLVSKGGGIDGRDHTDKGGNVTRVYATREQAEKGDNLPWNNIVPIVVDLDKVAKEALASLTPVQRFALARTSRINMR